MKVAMGRYLGRLPSDINNAAARLPSHDRRHRAGGRVHAPRGIGPPVHRGAAALDAEALRPTNVRPEASPVARRQRYHGRFDVPRSRRSCRGNEGEGSLGREVGGHRDRARLAPDAALADEWSQRT